MGMKIEAIRHGAQATGSRGRDTGYDKVAVNLEMLGPL